MTAAPAQAVALDCPDVVAEVLAAFGRYERALVDGNLAVLTELFWDDPRCVRFGLADRQHGGAQISAWRRWNPTVPAGRRLFDTHVLAIGRDMAAVSTLFGYPGDVVEGRQSQTWVRFEVGWREVAAHVSELQCSDLGSSDLGRSDLGRSDLGRSDLGRSDLGRG